MKDKIGRYTPLIIFIGIFSIGLLIKSFISDESLSSKVMDAVDVSSAVALAVLALLGYLEYIRSEDEVFIDFRKSDGTELSTGLKLLRKNCVRSELLGVLGMVQKDSSTRYDVAYFKNIRILEDLQAIQKGSETKLYIEVTEKELEQFDLPVQDQ